MRNLQKILALVLALIMSFSLVATAGAFSDDGDISDSYKTAVNVLNGLEVFKGYDNGATFQPKGNITRAEVAAIIYRIATGDVTDSQASIYSTYGQFTDVADGSWYAGYVNYCANAGYIKGRGNKIFDPQGQVTGYEALAMILRAVGYDKNGEFTGSNWQIRTASIANQRGITKNVTEGMLGQAATRETVAEILFRAILVNQVDFNANTLSYTEKATSLGYDSLKLEEIEGVITANEYADLNEDDTLPDGRTEMLVDGKDYTIDYTTTLDDIGESHIAYIQNGKKVLAINDREEGNVTAESTAKIADEAALKAFAKENSISLDKSAERYLNFSKGSRWMSDWRIRYEINFKHTSNDASVGGAAWRAYEAERADYGWTVDLSAFSVSATTDKDGNYTWTYSEEFKANKEISTQHQDNIKSIFDHADRFVKVEDNRDGYSYGEVYVGTSSLKDVSDSMSYNQFVTEYINADTEAKVESNEKGNWVKVIDNDKDGVADYVLKVIYTTAQVSKADGTTYTLDTKDTNLIFNNSVCGADELNTLRSEKVVSDDTLAVDDVVYYAVIDGKAQTYKAEPVTAKIDKVDRNNLTATTDDDTVYEQSGVHEHIYNPDYVSDVREMAGGVSYDMFLGRGGYLLAFVKSAAKSFTLLVDGYYNSTSKGDEYAVKAYQDGRIVNVDVTRNGKMFITSDGTQNNGWKAMRPLGGAAGTAQSLNAKGDVLKTTVAGLDVDGALIPVDFGSVYERGDHAMITFPKQSINNNEETYYNSIVKDAAARGFSYLTNNSSIAYSVAGQEVEIRALNSTVYYFVYRDTKSDDAVRVVEYTGYANIPSLSRADMQKIEDIYAVGTLRERVSTTAPRGVDYYTADIVVVEFKDAYTQVTEQIFIADSPVVGSGIQIDEVEVIRANGVKETISINLADSTLKTYNSAGYKRLAPGIYNLYPTSTENVYTVRELDAAEIAAYNFDVGNISTSNYTTSSYVGVNSMVNDSRNTIHSNGYNEYKITGDTKYYTLNYAPNSRYTNNNVTDWGHQDASLSESSMSVVLDERVDERDNKVQASFAYDLEDFHNNYKLWYGNYNNVMVAYNANNEAVYVISFANYDGDMSGNDGLRWDGATFLGLDGHNAYADFAQNVWAHIIPDQERTVNQAPGVELRVGGTTVQKLSADATVGIPYSVWKHFANPVNGYTTENTNTLMYFTPVLDTEISTRGAKTFMSDSFAVEYSVIDPTLVAAIPFIEEMTEDSQVYTTRVNVQSLTGNKVTSEYTYQYYFKAPNHAAQLLDVTSTNPLSKDSVKLGNDRYENLQAFVLAFEMSENATAVWHFTSERGENFTIIVAGGKVVWNNAPADIDTLREVLDTFSVDVYAECAISVFNETTGEIAPVLTNDSHKTTYSTNDIPGPGDEHSQEYTDAKAAYDKYFDAEGNAPDATKEQLTEVENAINAALADPSVLKDGEKEALEKMLQDVKDAPHYNDEDPGPGPGETDVSVNITYVLAITPNGGHLDKKATDGVLTLTKAELLTVIPAAILKHYTIESVTCDGNTVAPDADGNWTFTNVGSTLDLTVTWSGNFQGGGDSSGDGTVGGDGDTNVDWGRVSASARAAVEPGRDEGVLTVKVGKNQEINWDPEKTIFSEGTGYVESSIIRTPLDADFDLITMTVWRTTGLKNYVIYIALQDSQVEYNVTISTENREDVYSTTGYGPQKTEQQTAEFTVKSVADGTNSVLAYAVTPAGAATVAVEKTAAAISGGFYTWTVTITDVNADANVALSVDAAKVQVKSLNDKVSAKLVTAKVNGTEVLDQGCGTATERQYFIQLDLVDTTEGSTLPETEDVTPAILNDAVHGVTASVSTMYVYELAEGGKTAFIAIPRGSILDSEITVNIAPVAAEGYVSIKAEGRNATVANPVGKKGDALGTVEVTVGEGFTAIADRNDISSVTGVNPALDTPTKLEMYLDIVDGKLVFAPDVKITGNVTINLTADTGAGTEVPVKVAIVAAGEENAGHEMEITNVTIAGTPAGKDSDGNFYVLTKTDLTTVEITLSIPADAPAGTWVPKKIANDGVKTGSDTVLTFDQVISGDTLTINNIQNIRNGAETKIEIAAVYVAAPASKELFVEVDGNGQVTATKMNDDGTDKVAIDSGEDGTEYYLWVNPADIPELMDIVASWNDSMSLADVKDALNAGEFENTTTGAVRANNGVLGTNAKSISLDVALAYNPGDVLVGVVVKNEKVVMAGVSNEIDLDYTIQKNGEDNYTVTLDEGVTIVPVAMASPSGQDCVTIGSGKDVTINLNDGTISAPSFSSGYAKCLFRVEGNLTVEGPGSIVGHRDVSNVFGVVNDGKLMINGVLVDGEGRDGDGVQGTQTRNTAITVSTGGSATIDNCEAIGGAQSVCISVPGDDIDEGGCAANTEININNSTISGVQSALLVTGGVMTLRNTTAVGDAFGGRIGAGKLLLTDGSSIVGKGENTSFTNFTGVGVIASELAETYDILINVDEGSSIESMSGVGNVRAAKLDGTACTDLSKIAVKGNVTVEKMGESTWETVIPNEDTGVLGSAPVESY